MTGNYTTDAGYSILLTRSEALWLYEQSQPEQPAPMTFDEWAALASEPMHGDDYAEQRAQEADVFLRSNGVIRNRAPKRDGHVADQRQALASRTEQSMTYLYEQREDSPWRVYPSGTVAPAATLVGHVLPSRYYTSRDRKQAVRNARQRQARAAKRAALDAKRAEYAQRQYEQQQARIAMASGHGDNERR